jgi:hypothetical protein
MVLLLMKKRTLFSKIQAVRAHEVKLVSWASQLSLQALILACPVRTTDALLFSSTAFWLLAQRVVKKQNQERTKTDKYEQKKIKKIICKSQRLESRNGRHFWLEVHVS